MGANSKIEWTDHTFNPWIGCTKVSPACDQCYAERTADHRLRRANWGPGEPRVLTSDANWRKPLMWNRQAAAEGVRRRVFCASWADVFDGEVSDDYRQDLFALIGRTPNLDWLLLTKRPKIARAFMTAPEAREAFERYRMEPAHWPPRNVWLGTSVEDQKLAETRIPILLDTPAAVRFLSCEPLLGLLDLTNLNFAGWRLDALAGTCEPGNRFRGLDWVIAGGESGGNARPSHPDWFRRVRDQCQAAGVPFFFKQWGEFGPAPEGAAHPLECDPVPGSTGVIRTRRAADGTLMQRVGKKAAGRLLDGRKHNDMPRPTAEVVA